jgi:hypothetical protein
MRLRTDEKIAHSIKVPTKVAKQRKVVSVVVTTWRDYRTMRCSEIVRNQISQRSIGAAI